MFIRVTPTFPATSTNTGNASAAESKDAARGNNRKNFEIGRVLHFKSEIQDFELDVGRQWFAVQFKISDFGFEMQDSSNFKISSPDLLMNLSQQLLIPAVFFVEHNRALRCFQSLGQFPALEVGAAKAEPAFGVEGSLLYRPLQEVRGLLRRSPIEQ